MNYLLPAAFIVLFLSAFIAVQVLRAKQHRWFDVARKLGPLLAAVSFAFLSHLNGQPVLLLASGILFLTGVVEARRGTSSVGSAA